MKLEKDLSQAQDAETEDNKDKKKNFFPITWRVIGGGVLMGGKRTESPGGIGAYGAQVGDSIPIDTSAEGRGDGVGDAATGKTGFLKFGAVVNRPRSRSTSTTMTRPRTANGGREGNDNVSSPLL